MSSAPPPSGLGATRSLAIAFESGRRMAPDALRLSPDGATLEVDSILRAPLRLTLNQLHLAQVAVHGLAWSDRRWNRYFGSVRTPLEDDRDTRPPTPSARRD